MASELPSTATAPVVEARYGETEGRGDGALDGQEDGVEEVGRGGRVRMRGGAAAGTATGTRSSVPRPGDWMQRRAAAAP